ncbi:hypothetical protein EGM51_12825 [Verrucomicrobia bacterium S94]|nr:hypothetical protein EGM51_12825 [Verrucomicrobia bacterium S94]
MLTTRTFSSSMRWSDTSEPPDILPYGLIWITCRIIRILVGINVDNLLARSHVKRLLFKGNPQQTIETFLQEAKEDIQIGGWPPSRIVSFIHSNPRKCMVLSWIPEGLMRRIR